MKCTKNLSPDELKKERVDQLLSNTKDTILESLMGPFGLSRAMFNDKHGGNVTTLKNFENGIVSNKDDEKSYQAWRDSNQNGTNRDAYEASFNQTRKDKFKKEDQIKDGYTGENLPKDGRAHLDHIESVSSFEKSAKANLYMKKEVRIKTANSKENLTFTNAAINQSKNDLDMKDWLKKEKGGSKNSERFKINEQLTQEKIESAKKHKEKELNIAWINKDSKELFHTGLDQGARNSIKTALGLMMVDLTNGAFHEIKDIFKNGITEDVKMEADLARRLKKVVSSIVENKEKYGAALVDGGVSGFLSNLTTYLINHFISTAKNIVAVIREGFTSLLKALKMLLYPPEGMSSNDALREASKIFTAAVITALGVAAQESLKTFIASFPILAPISGELSAVIMSVGVGISSSIMVYLIDSFFDNLANPYALQNLNALIGNTNLQLELVSQFDKNYHTQNDIINGSNEIIVCGDELSDSINDMQENLNEILEKLKKIS